MSKNVEVKGEVSVRGSTPALIILFKTEDGTTYTVQSSPVASELARLEGMRLFVEGEARTPIGEGPPLLDVKAYRILPFESGDEPLVGWISVVDGGCMLKEADGTEWRITGTFVSNLLSFHGAKIWVIGKRWERDLSKREIRVTGYGVLARE